MSAGKTRRLLYAFLVLFLIISIVGLLLSGTGLPSRFILELYLIGPISETGSPSTSNLFGSERYGLYEIVDGLREAATDERIDAILVRIASLQTGWAAALEIRRAMEFVEQSGKPIRVLLEAGGDKEYLVACGADSVFMLPGGHLLMDGIAATVGFLGGSLAQIGLEVQAERVGEYKNAPDIFTETTMSESHREALDAVVGDLFQKYVDETARSREVSADDMMTIIDKGPYGAMEAVNAEIIDDTAYRSEILQHLGISDDIEVVSMQRYVSTLPDDGEKSVALVIVEGSMMPGGSVDIPIMETVAGSETIARALRKARIDKNIAGVLLRINSPGGSALAADIIIDELRRTVSVKPVVVSMGDLAASGGYYIAAPAHCIVAEPTTLTGSIGVYATKLVAEELYKTARYNVSVIKRGKHSDQFSPHRRFTVDERVRLGELMKRYYWDVFVNTVAEGRSMSSDAVDLIGRGRVWSGIRAEQIGLVDTLGGLWTARHEMNRLLRLPEDAALELVRLPRPQPLAYRLIDILFSSHSIEEYIRDAFLKGVTTQNGEVVQSRMPFNISIQ